MFTFDPALNYKGKNEVYIQVLFFFWLLYFTVYGWSFWCFTVAVLESADVSGAEVLQSFVHSVRMDASMGAYLSIIPFFYIPVYQQAHCGGKPEALSFCGSGTGHMDGHRRPRLVQTWGFRLDTSNFRLFCRTPKKRWPLPLQHPWAGWLWYLWCWLAALATCMCGG